MKHPYSIHQYTDYPVEDILDVLRVSLGDTSAAKPKTADVFHWEHKENIFGYSYGIVVVAEGRVIGARLLLRWRFRRPDGTNITAARAVSTATHPTHQGRGIFSVLTAQSVVDLSKEGVQCIFNTPNEKSMPKYLKLGWTVTAALPLYAYIQRPIRVSVRAILGKTSRQRVPKHGEVFTPEVLSPADFLQKISQEELDRFCVAASRSCHVAGYATERTGAYIRWRYLEYPVQSYGLYLHLEGPRLVGLAVLRRNERNTMREVVVSELLVEGGSAEEYQRLVDGVIRNVHADYLVAHFKPGSVPLRSIRRAGFIRVPFKSVVFTTKRLVGDGDLSSGKSWDLSLGDLELF
ncbi:MAG: GNAT family N-acetyltransferase [Candidatus Paceibacterota bacterium]